MRTGQLELTYAMEDALANDSEWAGPAAAWFASRPIGATFSAEDLTRACGRPHGKGTVGAAFNASRIRGEIRYIGQVRSARPSRHGNRNGLWERIA